MSFIINNRWKIVVTLVILLAACLVGVLILQAVNRKKAEEYKASMKNNWGRISDKSEAFTSELNGVKSTVDFGGLSEISEDFKKTIDAVAKEVEGNPPASSLNELHEKQVAALKSMSKYIGSMVELSSEVKINEFESQRAALDNRARKATADYNELEAMAGFSNAGITADTFNGANKLSDAVNNRGENYTQEADRVYEALEYFMDADIIQPNSEILWNMVSTARRAGLEKLGGNKDKMLEYRDAQWGKIKPKDYYISRSSINFPEPGVAEANVIAYMGEGMPRKAKVLLVLEPDGWKVFGYPFLGWLL